MTTKENASTQVPIFELVKIWNCNSSTFITKNTKDFAPGAIEGIAIKHGGIKDYDDGPSKEEILDSLTEALANTKAPKIKKLDKLLAKTLVIDWIDDFLREFAKQKFARSKVSEFARIVIQKSTNENSIKLAIALLGRYGKECDIEDIKNLGRYPEFSLYSLVAMKQLSKNYLQDCIYLAENSTDWGKLHSIERIAKLVKANPTNDNKRWLLLNGCDLFMPEYVAYQCADSIDLSEYLDSGHLDDASIDGACTLVETLIHDYRMGCIEDLSDPEDIINKLLSVIESSNLSSLRAYTVVRILNWLEFPEKELGQKKVKFSWEPKTKSKLIVRCQTILSRKEIEQVITDNFADSEEKYNWYSWRVASELGYDLWPLAFEKLCQHSCNPSWFWCTLDTENPDRIERVIDFAVDTLPFSEVASEQDYSSQINTPLLQCIDAVASEMNRFEMYREEIILACLQSKSTSLWLLALEAVKSKTNDNISPAVIKHLQAVPKEHLPEKSKNLLSELLETLTSPT